VVKENKSFHNFEPEIDVEELNGIDVDHILHLVNAYINILNQIGDEMRKDLFS
jgi:hypothetical protein